ncbi:MAG: hypothetical protein AB1810_05875 [Pseudomonadota bacterium]
MSLKIALSSMIAAGMLSACATTIDREYMLNSTLLSYERTIRWGDFTAANGFRKEGEVIKGVAPTSDRQIKVGAYDILSKTVSEDGQAAQQMVEIGYYYSDDVRMKKLRDAQTWEYDGAQQRWVITSPFPAFE